LGKRARMARIPVAVSGGACFALEHGESLPTALARLGGVLRAFAVDSDAARWKIETIRVDEWITRTSDFLLEEISKSLTTKSGIARLYDRVVLIEDERLTPANAVATILGLGPDFDIDVHTLVHGGKDAFFGFENARFDERSFFAPLRGRGLRFRAVYQMNCVSGTLMDEWLSLGAKTVNGTLDERNNYMPQSYFHFQREWARNAPFGSAVTRSYAQAREYTLPVYEQLGMLQEVEDSRMRVLGDTGLRAKPAAFQVAKGVVEAGARTALGLAEELRARGESLRRAAAALVAAGHGAAATADALLREYGVEARDVAAALGAAGIKTADVGAALLAKCSLSTKEMFVALRAAGGSVREAVRVLLKDQARSLGDCVRSARDAGAAVDEIVTALRHETVRRSYSRIARALKSAGVSPADIAGALKARGKRAGEVARWLQSAGVSARGVAGALRTRYACGVSGVVEHLEAAGFDFAGTARATWHEVIRRRARSTWPKAIGELTAELAAHFQLSVAWVAGELARLGIRP
ncbi:MAG: hypothetical protein AAFR54_23030, partial [Planctomycetota bacterium]